MELNASPLWQAQSFRMNTASWLFARRAWKMNFDEVCWLNAAEDMFWDEQSL